MDPEILETLHRIIVLIKFGGCVVFLQLGIIILILSLKK